MYIQLQKRKNMSLSLSWHAKHVSFPISSQSFKFTIFYYLSLHKILLTLLLLAVSRKPVITKQMVSFTISLSVAQWLGRRTEVMGLRSVRESDIFLYPTHVNSRFIFHIYRPSLELTIFHYISPQKKFSTSNDLLRKVSKLNNWFHFDCFRVCDTHFDIAVIAHFKCAWIPLFLYMDSSTFANCTCSSWTLFRAASK